MYSSHSVLLLLFKLVLCQDLELKSLGHMRSLKLQKQSLISIKMPSFPIYTSPLFVLFTIWPMLDLNHHRLILDKICIF